MSEGPLLALDRPAFYEIDTLFTQRLIRWRWVYFALLAILVVVPFNGEWRMGVDSPLYRGVAENLVAGNGYTFAGMKQTQVYPGLPFLLAGLQKLTGANSVVPALIVMNVCALLALWVTYKLILTRYPMWIAVVVTCGVAMNVKFVQQAQEVMTDMPHLLGIVTAMLGWEMLRDARRRRDWLRGGAVLVVGLTLAAVMRPTFWVLAVALVLTCLWNILRRRELRSIVVLSALAMVVLLTVTLDPRVRGLNLLQGGYEHELVSMLGRMGTRMAQNAPGVFGIEITEAFFNEPLGYFAWPLVAMLIVGAAMVMRRQPLWGLQFFILTSVTLVLSDVPRYYIIVLPTLWVGYTLVLLRLTTWIRPYARDWTLFAMFSLANFLNLAGVAALVYEQHRPGDFLTNYRDGSYVRYVKMARIVREKVPADARVVGPYANLLTYLSGRTVLSGRMMGFDENALGKYPSLLAKHNPTYMIGPADRSFAEKDAALASLIDHGVVQPIRVVDSVHDKSGSLWLAEAKVIVPTVYWKTLPTTRPMVIAQRPKRELVLTPEKRAYLERLKRRERDKERAAYRARVEKRRILAEREAARKAAREKAAATQPATQPTTQPTTRPSTQPVSIRIDLRDIGAMWWPVSPRDAAHT